MPLKWLLIVMITLIVTVLICLAALNIIVNRATLQGQTAGVLPDMDTGEETVYSLEILRYADIKNDYIKSWIDGKRDRGDMNGQSVYYTLYNDVFEDYRVRQEDFISS